MQKRHEDNLPILISLGWVMLLLVLLICLVIMIIHSIVIVGNFDSLRLDPGRFGMNLIISLFGIYAVMPIVVYFTDRTGFRPMRWVLFALSTIFLLFFVLHHLSHWQFGDRPDFMSHILELAHHSIGLWVIYLSFRWARLPKEAKASNAAPARTGDIGMGAMSK